MSSCVCGVVSYNISVLQETSYSLFRRSFYFICIAAETSWKYLQIASCYGRSTVVRWPHSNRTSYVCDTCDRCIRMCLKRFTQLTLWDSGHV